MPTSRWCRFAAAVLLTIASSVLAGTYGGGNGTVDNPYRLGSTTHWQELSITPDDWGAHFVMTGDIDFGGGAIPQIAPDTNPLYGHQGTPFTGVFDGAGFALRDGTVGPGGGSSDHVALFGMVGPGGEIRNLTTTDITVAGGEDSCAILVGYLEQGTLTNCQVGGSVSGNDNVGGLVGETWRGIIDDCGSSATVTGIQIGSWDPIFIGGLVGYNNGGTISGSHATGAVVGDEYVGGLIGNHEDHGGGGVTRCYATGSVTGVEYVGGLIGGSGCQVSDSYAQGAVTGADYVGGLFGFDTSTTSRCYATGLVTCTGTNRGGLTGHTNDTFSVVTACFWDTESTNQPASPAGTAKDTAEMQTEATFTDAGWDFATVWTISPGEYPRLRPPLYVVTFVTDGTAGATLTGGVTTLAQTVARGADADPVTAFPPPGLRFLGWIGDVESVNNPLTVTSVTGPMTITAIFGNPVAAGAILDFFANDIDLLKFSAKPKAYAVFTNPVTRKPNQKATVKILDKVSAKNQAGAVRGEWTKRLRLYNSKTFAAAQKAGEDAVTWLSYAPNQQPLLMTLRLASKEANPVDRQIRNAQLRPPAIAGGGIADNGDGTLTITGSWFGTKKPKAWREYEVIGKNGTIIKRQALKVLVNLTAGLLDSKGKPACMDPDSGDSSIIVVVPTKEPKGTRNGDIVIENGVGLAVGDDPTWIP